MPEITKLSSVIIFQTYYCLKNWKKKELYPVAVSTVIKRISPLAADKTLNRGDFDYRCTSNTSTVFKSIDLKAVYFISNYHAVQMNSVQRKEKDGSKITVSCLNVVKDHNKIMGRVDKHDMLHPQYGVNRKSLKW